MKKFLIHKAKSLPSGEFIVFDGTIITSDGKKHAIPVSRFPNNDTATLQVFHNLYETGVVFGMNYEYDDELGFVVKKSDVLYIRGAGKPQLKSVWNNPNAIDHDNEEQEYL